MTQLYSAGALKIACVGLQCIGFNNTLYRTILEQAAKCMQSGKWRIPFGTGTGSPWVNPLGAEAGYGSLSGPGSDTSVAGADTPIGKDVESAQVAIS